MLCGYSPVRAAAQRPGAGLRGIGCVTGTNSHTAARPSAHRRRPLQPRCARVQGGWTSKNGKECCPALPNFTPGSCPSAVAPPGAAIGNTSDLFAMGTNATVNYYNCQETIQMADISVSLM